MGTSAQKHPGDHDRERYPNLKNRARLLADREVISHTEGFLATLRESKKKVIQGFREGWSVTGAANLAGVQRATVYQWRENDPEFAQAWDDAWESGADVYEDKLKYRALEANKGEGDTVALIVRLKQRKRFVERPAGEDVVLAAGAVLAMLRQAAQRELPPALASDGAIEGEARPLPGGSDDGEGSEETEEAPPSNPSLPLEEVKRAYDVHFPRA